jgi:biotin operon repressor
LTQSDPSRAKFKSPEQSLAWRLSGEAGLCPAQIHVVKNLLLDHQQAYWNNDRAPGSIVFSAVAKEEPAGKPIKHCRIVPVRLSIFLDSDGVVLATEGTVVLRGLRLQRMANEAFEQRGLLSHEDLAALLGVDPSTVQDHVRQLREKGYFVPTRGYIADIGPIPTHKREISRLLGQGHTTCYIRSATGHSEGAIGRYQRGFALVIYLLHAYPGTPRDQLREISGLEPKAWDTYVEVYDELSSNSACQPHLERLRRFHEMDPDGLAAQIPPGKRPEDLAQKRLDAQTLQTTIRQTIQEDLGTTKRVAQAVADDILEIVENAFPVSDNLRPGETVVLVDKHDPSFISGEKVADRPVMPVTVPLHTEQAIEIWRSDEPIGLRRARIAALIATVAHEQGGVFNVAGLAELLHVPPSTMARDLRELAAEVHMQAPTKGLVEDAGPTLTHKDWIIDLDHHGLSGEEISWLTRHAPMSRDRYVTTFRRAEALMRVEGGIPNPEHLGRVLRLRTHIAKQYVDLLERFHGEHKPQEENPPTDPA